MRTLCAGLVGSILLLFFTGQQSHAQSSGITGDFYLGGSLFYLSDLRTRNSRDEKSRLVYDVRAAYQIYPEFFLGINYQGEQENTKASGYSSDSLNNSSQSSRTSYGPSVSYMTDTFNLSVTYYMASKWDLETATSTSTTRYSYSGSGFQADIAYKFPIWGMHVGPQLSYRLYTYDKLSTNGGSSQSIAPKLEESTFEPSLTFYFFF